VLTSEYQVPAKKVLKMNYGVSYLEKNSVVLEGEAFNKKPNKKTQYTQ